MKFFHLADLHFGKQLNGLSLSEPEGSQEYWCRQCLEAVDAEKPDCVLIAGDVFDRSQPGAEARALASWFLTELAGRTKVLMIAGNHDSGENVGYLSGLLEKQGLYASGRIARGLPRVTLSDEYGPVTFWLMPYFFPLQVKELLGQEELRTYTEAAAALLSAQEMDPSGRNVLIAHQFVTDGDSEPERGGSETSVGGIGQIDAGQAGFGAFDYVALGHIHRPQSVGREAVRYAGAPLCYHFSEAGETDEGNARLGILVVTLGKKGEAVELRRIKTPPLHPLRTVRGKLSDILEAETAGTRRGEYLRVQLEDEVLPVDTRERLEDTLRPKDTRIAEIQRIFTASGSAEAPDREMPGEKPLAESFFDYYDGQYPDRPMDEEEQRIALEAVSVLEETGGALREEADLDRAAVLLADRVLREVEG